MTSFQDQHLETDETEVGALFPTSFPTGKTRRKHRRAPHRSGLKFICEFIEAKFRFKSAPTERKDHLNVSETDSHLRFNKPRSGVTSRVFGRPLFGNACHLFGFPHLLVLLLGLMPSLLCGWKTLWGSLNAHRDPLYE